MDNPIDCVIVGYREFPMDTLFERAKQLRNTSATYEHLLANTVRLHGERVRYSELFNRSMLEATGEHPAYHVAKMPNLGVVYLASFLRTRGYTAEIINFVNAEESKLRDLLQAKPRLVAITTTFYVDETPIRAIVDLIRSITPNALIVVGGPHIFNMCSALKSERAQDGRFRNMGADIYILDPQGESTLARLCHELREADPDLRRVPNLAYLRDGRTFERTPIEKESNDLDVSAIDWKLFDKDFIAPLAQLRTARSCAFNCSFCRFPFLGGALTLQSVASVEKQLDDLARAGVSHLFFIDDTFNIPKKRFKDLCRMMIKNRYDFTWFSFFRCANADDESFDLLAKAGCRAVFLGIESADRTVLRNMNKGATPERYGHGLNMLRERGVLSYASFIMGFPGETAESAQRTIDFIKEYRPTFFSMETFYYDPNTPIAHKADEFGLKGNGYSWSHNSMDWSEASHWLAKAYMEITESVICPSDGFDLWTIAYLMARGFDYEAIEGFLKIASKALKVSRTDNGDAAVFLPELAQVLRNHPARPRQLQHFCRDIDDAIAMEATTMPTRRTLPLVHSGH